MVRFLKRCFCGSLKALSRAGARMRGVGWNERLVAEFLAVGANEFGIVGGVHDFALPAHTFGTHQHQRNGNLRIMHGGAGEDATDGNAAIGDVPVQLETAPVLRVTLAVFLGAQAALLGSSASISFSVMCCWRCRRGPRCLASARFGGCFRPRGPRRCQPLAVL